MNSQQLAGWLAASRRNPPHVGFDFSFSDAKAAGSSALNSGLDAAKSEASAFADQKFQEGKEAAASAVRSEAGDAAGNIVDAALGVNQNIMFSPAMLNVTSSMLNKRMLSPAQRSAFLEANKARNITSRIKNLQSRGVDLSRLSQIAAGTVIPPAGGGSGESPFLDAGPAPSTTASETSAAEDAKSAKAAKGLSTGAKVGIGLGVAAVVGGAAWFILKSRV